MNLVTHGLVGAALGTMVSPWLALPVGMASHAVLDMIPHTEYKTSTGGVIDLTLAVAAVGMSVVVTGMPVNVLLGASGAILPDSEVVVYYLGGQRTRMRFPSHSGLLRHRQVKSLWGYVTMAVFGLAAVAWMLWGRAP